MDLSVVRQWPGTTWAPDAALDLARAMVGMKETREACGVLSEIDSHYPKANAAVRAGEVDVKGQAGCAAG
jgi:TolA-binding protein